MKLKIARMGERVLRKDAENFEIGDILKEQTKQLLNNMYFTMKNNEDGVGIAAPQVFIPKRLIIVENKILNVPKMALFNPEIEGCELSGKIRVAESCLSVPGLVGDVQRFAKIKVKYLDENAKKKELIATGFVSAMFQHECDHLNSTLFVDRVIQHTLSYQKEWEKNILPQNESDYCFEGSITFL
eukprot:TRINITY_DN17786_c0_g1_i1.p1 TRINITY_DN17786_c0_g1~~TRINITY_DN17786_c0_g1_i1.p1  ORF type:complete len:185 (+),score=44.64 TRINITY_DN17786_c0_g1_i1:231-785(+)